MKWGKKAENLIFFAILLIACLKMTYGLYDALDINLVDEHGYLLAGIKKKVYLEYSPLYSLWYYFLSFFSENNITLMFLNFKVLSILFPCAMYWLLIKLGVEPFFSLLLSFLLLYSGFNLPMSPKVTMFMNFFQIAILWLSASKLNKETRNIWIALVLFVSYYVRPEYRLAFLLFFVYMLIRYVYYWRKGIKPEKIWMFVLLLILITGISVFVGFPFKNQSGKEMLAFGSSFALNYVKWHHMNINPWSDWFHIMNKSFGKVSSISEALMANPALFFRHMFSNIKDYAWIFIYKLIPTFIPVSLIGQSVFSAVLFFLVAVGTICFYLMNYKLNTKKELVIQQIKRYDLVLFLSMILLIPNVISIILITTRYHYITLQLPVFATLLAVFGMILSAKKNTARFGNKPFFLEICLGFFLILLTPLPAQNSLLKECFKDKNNLAIVKQLDDLKLNDKDTIRSLNCDLMIFTKYRSQNTSYFDKFIGFNNVILNINFYRFLDDHRFNLIQVDGHIKNQSDYKKDREWQEFQVKYDSFGFRKVIIDTGSYYLVKKDIVSAE